MLHVERAPEAPGESGDIILDCPRICRVRFAHRSTPMTKSVLSADHFHDEAAALAFIEARLWPNGPVCPHCGEAARVGRINAKGFKIGMCKCYACRKKFSVTNKTVMESSHIPLH